MRLTILRAPDLGPRGLALGNVVEVAPLEAARLLAAGEAVHTPGAKITVPDGFAGFGTFASLPAASTGVMLAGATDIGGSALTLLRSDGTRWRPLGPCTLASFLCTAGSPTAVAAGGAETQFGGEFLVPAGLVQPGDRLRFSSHAFHDTLDTGTRIIGLRTKASSGGAFGSLFAARYSSASSTLTQTVLDKVGKVLTATQIVWGNASSAAGIASASTPLVETVDNLASDVYLRFTVTPTAGSNWKVYSADLALEPLV